jgi:hypothetical protein
MSAVMWGLLLLLIVWAGLANVVGGLQSLGVRWAYQVCVATGPLCDHPGWLAIAAASTAVAYAVMKRISV